MRCYGGCCPAFVSCATSQASLRWTCARTVATRCRGSDGRATRVRCRWWNRARFGAAPATRIRRRSLARSRRSATSNPSPEWFTDSNSTATASTRACSAHLLVDAIRAAYGARRIAAADPAGAAESRAAVAPRPQSGCVARALGRRRAGAAGRLSRVSTRAQHAAADRLEPQRAAAQSGWRFCRGSSAQRTCVSRYSTT